MSASERRGRETLSYIKIIKLLCRTKTFVIKQSKWKRFGWSVLFLESKKFFLNSRQLLIKNLFSLRFAPHPSAVKAIHVESGKSPAKMLMKDSEITKCSLGFVKRNHLTVIDIANRKFLVGLKKLVLEGLKEEEMVIELLIKDEYISPRAKLSRLKMTLKFFFFRIDKKMTRAARKFCGRPDDLHH